MPQRTGGVRAVLPWAAALLGMASGVATLGFAIANRSTIPSLDAADPISIVMPITFAIVGGLIATRSRSNVIGWLLLFIAIVIGVNGLGDQYARYALITHPGSLPGADWALWLYQWSSTSVYPCGAAALLLLLLPDGHLPSRRWKPLLVAGAVLTAVTILFAALAPAQLTVTDASSPTVNSPVSLGFLRSVNQGPLLAVAYIVGLAILLAAAAAPPIRMRRAGVDERQQLKWIAYAVLLSAIIAAVFTVGTFVPFLPAPAQGALFAAAIVLGFGTALPLSISIAIFRYRLYDIDLVISRTLVYGALAVFITAVYVGIAVGIGTLVGSGGKPNLGLSILATAIVAIGFQPVRERLQRVANRLVYGKRASPYEALSQFSQRAAESYSLGDVLPRMARVLAEGAGAERADVWLRSGDVLHPTASWPENAPEPEPIALNGSTSALLIPDALRTVAVSHQGELLGALSLSKRRGEALTPVENKLIDDLAHQAGLVLKNVRLTADLQRRLEELRASRQRLVAAQDGERRRLERNLHDGAQQHLVALKVKLGLAEALLSRDPEKARSTITQLKGDADEALETLRDLARGIYPPLLADRGLAAALQAQARKATLPVNVDADSVGRYPQDVEAALYFCALEALQNTQKYAGATQATVRLRQDGDILRVEIADDGTGFDESSVQRGAGLTNMEDRLDALGGTLQLSSRPGAGTTLIATVPVTEPAAQVSAL